MKIIDVAGLKKSGKTTIVENIVKELTTRGYKVGTIKKIHIPSFTIDTEGKDTFRHKNAGAEFVISLAPEEVALIKTLNGPRELASILQMVPKETDFLICEELNEVHNDIKYIIALKNLDNLEQTMKVRSIGDNIIAISGVVANSEVTHEKYPIINVTTLEGKKKIVDLILA